MLDQGFLEEVENLIQKQNASIDMPSMKCVGYRQAMMYLQGSISLEEMKDKAKAATRQLAKRQMTWLRNWTQLKWVDSFAPTAQSSVLEKVDAHLQEHPHY